MPLLSRKSCADVVNPLSAILVGGIAGIVANVGAILLEKMKLDDVVGAVPVHLFCGIRDTLSVALFHEEGFNLERLGTRLFGALGICIGAFFVALILFKVIDTFIGLRVSDEEQEDGRDFTEHSVNAYADFQKTEN